MPYECGIDPIDSARGRYTVRYYIIAILFVVFDVETIFLFPWAVRFKAFGLFGLLEMLIFLAILVVGLHLGVEKRRAGVGVRNRLHTFDLSSKVRWAGQPLPAGQRSTAPQLQIHSASDRMTYVARQSDG